MVPAYLVIDCSVHNKYGEIASAGGPMGLLPGGALTEYLSWRWTLYVNLALAVVAFTGEVLQRTRLPYPESVIIPALEQGRWLD